MSTEREIYQRIEGAFSEYEKRQIDVLLNSKDLEAHELLASRGKGQGAREVLRMIRSALGYDHSNI